MLTHVFFLFVVLVCCVGVLCWCVVLVVCWWCVGVLCWCVVLVSAALVCCVGELRWWCVLRSMRADMLNPCVLKAI